MISDPGFYAAAIPAVLLLGLAKSGFGVGFGSLATPLLALAVPVPQAAAILLPVLLVIDVLGVSALIRHCDWVLVRRLLPTALLGIAVGALTFGLLPTKTVAGVVGAITLGVLAVRVGFPPRADAPPPSHALGRVLAGVSGFTSFVAHAGGPPIGFYVLPLKLAPIVLSSTLGVFFAVVNLAKWAPYAALGLLDLRNFTTSLALLPFAPVGVWVGVRFVKRASPQLFYRLFHAGLFCAGVKLLYDGFF